MQKIALIFAAFYGLSGVGLGAMGAHLLKKILSPELLDSFTTGTKYQIYHALFLFILGILPNSEELRFYKAIVICGILGVLCFSGSIYLLTLLRLKAVAMITPLGGLLLMIAWGLLLVSAFLKK